MDFCKEDRKAWAAVWPIIEATRVAGKRDYYRGAIVYINGAGLSWFISLFGLKSATSCIDPTICPPCAKGNSFYFTFKTNQGLNFFFFFHLSEVFSLTF